MHQARSNLRKRAKQGKTKRQFLVPPRHCRSSTARIHNVKNFQLLLHRNLLVVFLWEDCHPYSALYAERALQTTGTQKNCFVKQNNWIGTNANKVTHQHSSLLKTCLEKGWNICSPVLQMRQRNDAQIDLSSMPLATNIFFQATKKNPPAAQEKKVQWSATKWILRASTLFSSVAPHESNRCSLHG